MFKDLVPDGDENAEPSPTLLVVGYYRDRFRRTSEGWKVAHRDLTHSSQTPHSASHAKGWWVAAALRSIADAQDRRSARQLQDEAGHLLRSGGERPWSGAFCGAGARDGGAWRSGRRR